MKDHQVAPTSAEPRIFLVSPVLHCISMTALVYLRSNFGFGYLRPKSIFIALSWAFTLYAIYAWVEGDVWQEHRAALWFGAGAMILYWLHLLRSVRREWRGDAEHDNFAGVPCVQSIMKRFGALPLGRFDGRWRLWGEPATALFAALCFYLIGGERHLSLWLMLTACCLWTKEILNQWFDIRRQKRRKDITEDAAEAFDGEQNNGAVAAEPPKATARKARVNRPRAYAPTVDETAITKRHAEILRLLPPYDLATAERNYHALIKDHHPDTNAGSSASKEHALRLNEAIEFFRSSFKS